MGRNQEQGCKKQWSAWVNHDVPVRQWVLTLPFPLRFRMGYDARLTSDVLRAFLRTVFASLRRRARRQWSICWPQCGAVTLNSPPYGGEIRPLAPR